MKKGVFPYEWWDSFEKGKVDHLPSMEEFENNLVKTKYSNEGKESKIREELEKN